MDGFVHPDFVALAAALQRQLAGSRGGAAVCVPRHAFGHFGFGGSGGWADPSRDLAVALIVNSGMGTPFGDLRIARIGGAALAAANARRQRDRLLPALRPSLPAATPA